MFYDIVIVGAGPGGIFAAYELVNSDKNLKIAIFEAGHPLDKRKCPIDGDKIKSCINCKTGTLAAVLHVDSVDVFHQFQRLFSADMFVQRTAEVVGDIVFTVGKSTGTAKTAHNAAGVAVNAVVNLLGCQRSEALFDRIAGLQHNNLQLRILQHKLIGGKNCGRTATDNGYIIHKFSSSSYPIKKPQPHFLTAVYQLIAVVPAACAGSLAAASRF